ncbi:MAG: sel1 repeat family protein [Acidobacteriia bacterium]|nr:sel1 repeat family protein [Terriglobia bacterium]
MPSYGLIATIAAVLTFNSSEIIQKAAKGGDPFAEFELGLAFEYGSDYEQDFERAFEWYAKAADQGHTVAEGNILAQHVLGQVSKWEPKTVLAQLKTRAESGDIDAQSTLGLCYKHGYGTEVNYTEAALWFRRAAHGGLAMGQFNLGSLYYDGQGLQKDLALAAEWYTRAAQQREELALLRLGEMYQKGLGVELDLNRAVVLYSIAYRRGSVRAANHLGFMFKKGLGVERDDSTAYELYLTSVNCAETPEAKENSSYRGTGYYWLGYMAENGEGVKRDLRTAKRWYGKGAACGQSNCVKALARLRSKADARRCRDGS